MLVGIDEVGRGCWAGPLVVVAAHERGSLPVGLRDSKKLSAKQRQSYIEAITTSCDLGVGWVEPAEIDQYGLSDSMRLAVSRALNILNVPLDASIIMDGSINYCAAEYSNVQCVIKADDLYPIVSAASVYAKVVRDQHMVDLAAIYPDYGFEKHVGYGTSQHRDAIVKHGVLPVHRKSYKPIKQLLM